MTTLVERLPMIPRLTASAGSAECLAQEYVGWELLEADASTMEILICKPCSVVWEYTRSKHLLILCDEVAAVWQCQSEESVYDMKMMTTHKHGLFLSLADVWHSTVPHIIGR